MIWMSKVSPRLFCALWLILVKQNTSKKLHDYQSSSVFRVLYMYSSYWLLGVESQDFSHADKERTACKDEQIHNMTIIFTENGPRLSFFNENSWHFVNFHSFASSFFLLSLRKITWFNSQQPKNRPHVEHLGLLLRCFLVLLLYIHRNMSVLTLNSLKLLHTWLIWKTFIFQIC